MVTMKFNPVTIMLVVAVLGVGALIVMAEESEGAHDYMSASIHVTERTSIGNERCWKWLEESLNFIGGCTSTSQATAVWQGPAGQSKTIKFRQEAQGALAPAEATNMLLQLRVDDSTTIIRTLHNGPVPVDGTTIEFWFTSNGLSGGTPTAGTYKLYMEIERTNIPTYNTNCDEDNSEVDRCGAFRGQMVVSNLADNGPPTGSFYAFGIPNESVTVVTSHTNTFSNDNRGVAIRSRNDITDAITKSVNTVFGLTGTTNAVFVVNNMYEAALRDYDSQINITGISDLTGQQFTSFALTGHGTGLIRENNFEIRVDKDYAIDPRIRIDSHTQSDSTLIKDNFPNEDASETHAFVIGDSVLNVWAHVVNARTEDLDTAINTVTIQILDPDSVVQDSLTTQTAADGWTPTPLQFPATAPGGVWIAKAAVTVTGASATDEEEVSFQSPASFNKQIRIFSDSNIIPGVNNTIIARIELNDFAVNPDTVPEIRISRYFSNPAIPWDLEYEDILTFKPMFNAIDKTRTVMGPTYFYNYTFEEVGFYSIQIRANITGTLIREAEPWDLVPEEENLFTALSAGFIGMETQDSFTLIVGFLVLFWALRNGYILATFPAIMLITRVLIPNAPLPGLAAAFILLLAALIVHTAAGPVDEWRLFSARDGRDRGG